MMCACDRAIGEKFLPHQLSFGRVLETQQRIRVTLGFVNSVCEQCRTGKSSGYPVAAAPGRTSKIKRYYWRELAFRKMELFEHLSGSSEGYLSENPDDPSEFHKRAEAEALEDIKRLHAQSPRYDYQEESSEDVLRNCNVAVRDVCVEYAESTERKSLIWHGGKKLYVEQFAQAHYTDFGYQTLICESVPFHVLFGVFTWILIQDQNDPLCRPASFGERSAYERDRSKKNLVSALLPSDFGTPSYCDRRAIEVAAHLTSLRDRVAELAELFELWLEQSWSLRQYLWAHRERDIETARQVVNAIPGPVLIRIVEYLIGAYWERYLGWPDILAVRKGELLFVEVKSSGDKFSLEQKRWIQENFSSLKLPFEVLRLHRQSKQQ